MGFTGSLRVWVPGAGSTGGAALVAPVAATVAVDSTILASSTPAASSDCRGTIDTGTANLVESPAGCTRASGDTLAGPPGFRAGGLANYGGPTQTIALSLSSQAINAGSNPASLTTDQRGQPRVLSGGIDIGAVEVLLPVAVNDTATVALDSGATPISVLANDTPGEFDAPQLTSVTAPAHGAAVIAGANVNCTPAAGFCGADSFGYTIAGGSSATVAVAVSCAAPPPPPTPVPARITALRVSPSPFAVAHPRLPRGTKVIITLTKDATVDFLIRRNPQRPGHDPAGHRVTKKLKQGTTRLPFSGINDAKTFRPGKYTISAIGTDADGLRSNRRTASYRIGN